MLLAEHDHPADSGDGQSDFYRAGLVIEAALRGTAILAALVSGLVLRHVFSPAS
jgi:hypothetical protein